MIYDLKNITILYVEDEDDVRDGYSRALARVCKELYLASNGKDGLELYKVYKPDIVVSDIRMPIMNGLDMVKEIQKIDEKVNIVFTTAHSESTYLLDAIGLHVDGYLLKPVEKKAMMNLIRKLSKNIMLERENSEQRQILQHIINAENSLSLIVREQKAYFASRSFLNLFNLFDVNELNEKYSSIIDLFDIEDLDGKSGCVFYDYIMNLDEVDRVITIKDIDNNTKSFYVNVSKISPSNCLINLTNITKIEQKLQITNTKAYIDNLTQVYNRNKFEEFFEYELIEHKRYNKPFSIAILDIDNFKLFNDKYGHLVGDDVLITLAQTLKDSVRGSDLFARWGGEEFVILFSNTTLENAFMIADRFRKKIEELKYENIDNITVSFGLAQFRDGDDLKTLFKRADEALYIAKKSGRNCVKSK